MFKSSLMGCNPDNEQEGERMRVAVQADKREGRLKTLVRRVNERTELKPNVAGIGVNLNALIEDWLNKEGR